MPSHDPVPGSPSDRPSSFQELLERARAGDQHAATALHNTYRDHVLRVIRHRLLPPESEMRRLIDSTDVLQEAMDAAFKAVHDPNAFNDEASFVAFLVVVSENCVRKHHRTQHTQGRDADRNEQCKVPDAASHAPGPLALAASADQWRQVLSELPPAHKAILRLLKAGRSHAEIMELLDVTDRMIQRVVKHARERFADETGK